MERLRQQGLVDEVIAETRYVRNGNVVTAAGVSAGIDMALWLLGQMYSPELAPGYGAVWNTTRRRHTGEGMAELCQRLLELLKRRRLSGKTDLQVPLNSASETFWFSGPTAAFVDFRTAEYRDFVRNIGNIHFELVIFDCDGVLIDSEIISAHALATELKRLGLPIDLSFVLVNFLGRSFPTVVLELKNRFGLQLEDNFESIYRTRLVQEFENRLEIMPGVEQVLNNLAVKSCVATSSSPPRVRRSLEIVGLDDFFHGRVFTASAVKNGKPAPDLFLHVADKMGCDPSACLVIEDSIPGVRAALAAGMTVWHFSGGSHLKSTGFELPDDATPQRTFDSFYDFFEVAPELQRTVSNGIPE